MEEKPKLVPAVRGYWGRGSSRVRRESTEDGNLLSLHVTVEQRGLRLTAALTRPVFKWECNHSTAHLKNVIKFTGNWILDAELIWELTFSHSKVIISCPGKLYQHEMTHLHKSFHRCAGQTSCGTSTWGRDPSPHRYAGSPRYRSCTSLSRSIQLTLTF